MTNLQDMGILIVVDEATTVRSLEDALRKNGYAKVRGTTSSLEGLEMIGKDGIDAVLLDIIMPEMDGFEFCQRIRSDSGAHDVEIIMLTDEPDKASAVFKKALDVGAMDLIRKPVNPEELLLKVNRALRIKKVEKTLLETEKEYRALVQNLNEIIFILRSDGTIRSITGNWEKYVGDDTELEGGRIPFVDLITKDDRGPFLELFKHIIQNEGSKALTEFGIVNKDGTLNYFSTSLTQLANDNGGPSSVLGVARDITSQRKAEDEAKMANAIMTHQRRMAQIGEMVSAIAHQWRQPLNNIMMVVNNINDALVYDELDEDKLVSSIDLIQAELTNTSDVINEFMDFFKPDPDPSIFDITEAIQSALFLIMAQFESRGAELEMDLPLGKYFIYGKVTQMKQVFLNALSNARDVFEMERVEHPRLGIEVGETEEGWVRIEVWDNGGGVPRDLLPVIFDVYTTTKPPERGTGLGLYICRMIVEKSFGGRIELQNKGDGAVLTITVPQVEINERTGSEENGA